MTAWTMSCRTLSVIEVGTSTWRQITGSVSWSSMRTVAISLKLLDRFSWLGSCRQFVRSGLPIPGDKLIEVLDIVIVDAGEHVSEPRLRIDTVELGGLDRRVHDRGTLAAAVGAGKQPRLATERNAAQLALGGIVAQANPSILKKAREGGPTFEHVVHR